MQGRSAMTSLPSPSMKTRIVLVASAASDPALHAAPYPRREVMTRAPAAAAISPVPSEEPLSTTMHSAMRGLGIEATTWPMDSRSLRAGMMTEIWLLTNV